MKIKNCKLVEFSKISDPRGNLAVIENLKHIPFAIKRVYYLYDTPNDVVRGHHAHKALEQVAIAISGSMHFILDDGTQREKIVLDKPNVGLYMGPKVWHEMTDFSQDAVCLLLASEVYQEEDYIRNYQDFLLASKA